MIVLHKFKIFKKLDLIVPKFLKQKIIQSQIKTVMEICAIDFIEEDMKDSIVKMI